MASGGEDGARRAEKVREIAGKTFHLFLRCLPTADERCVAGSTSALPPRQPAREEPRGCGRGKRLSVRGAGGYDSITFSRQSVKLRAAQGAQQRTVSGRLGFRVGSSYRAQATCLSESRTGGRLCPLRWEVNVYVVCRYRPHPHPSLLMFVCQATGAKRAITARTM